jgi:hypothetical protein
MAGFTVIYDACVLYPAPLRDVLMEIATEHIFMPRWTDQIHDEWIGNLLKNRPDLGQEALQRTRDMMNRAVADCLVTGYEPLVEGLNLPDPDDRHVLAAAIVAQAGVIVTFNVRDFPREVLSPYGIEAQHPDDFLTYQFDLARTQICGAVKRLRSRLKKPPRAVDEYLTTLEAQQLPQFVRCLRKSKDLL